MRKPPLKSKARTGEASAPVWLPAVLLVLATIALYWPATRCDFNNFDDPVYITANPHVQGGLNWESIKWAFFNPVVGNWHPLTMLSHMMGCQLFGLNPWGHHLVNVLFHALNAALVFALLKQLTGATWRSLLVAVLFAVHPLRVESVAWISERKGVLSGFFGLLTLIFYARYAQAVAGRESGNQGGDGSMTRFRPATVNYMLTVVFFTLGLMSKPVLVTWPFVLLLLDYWPLERFKPGSGWRLVKEKLPFIGLAAAASVVTFLVQKQAGAMLAAENIPLGARVGNALVSYCRYLGKMIWPMDLAVVYPYPGYWPLMKVLLAGGLLMVISVVLFLNRRRYPFMLMGWLWFVGTLVPTIGLVQMGIQAMADRYTYLPSLGVLILVIWGAEELTRRWRHLVIPLGVVGLAAIVLCMALTHQQLKYWQDSETLFRHALAVTENNLMARYNLGTALLNEGRTDEAISQYREAIRISPDYPDAHNNLGNAFFSTGENDEAIDQYRQAIRYKPDYAEACKNLGTALLNEGRTDEAIRQFQEAIRLKPDYVEARYDLGNTLLKQGQMDDAIRQFQEAIRFKPDYAEAYNNLGTALVLKGRMDDAIRQFQEAIRLKPDVVEAHYNVGNILLKQGRINEAISQYEETLRLKPDFAMAHNNLANALGSQGQMDAAIGQFQEAIRLKPDYAEAHKGLGVALTKQGKIEEAIGEFREAIRLKPDYAEARRDLAIAIKMEKAPPGH